MPHLKLVINDEKFMIDLNFVKEIIPNLKFVQSFEVSDTIDGYINLRGTLIPVLDLSMFFFKRKLHKTMNNRIIILENQGHVKREKLGVLVSSTVDVTKFGKDRFNAHVISQPGIEGITLDTGEIIKKINVPYLFDFCFHSMEK